jgi:predicted Zn-dependent protease
LPVLFGQSAYSRDFERAADAEAIRLLQANRLSPMVMVELFDRLEAQRAAAKDAAGTRDDDQPFTLGIALASHPADAERIQTFRAAARL